MRVWRDYSGESGVAPELVTAWQALSDMIPSTGNRGTVKRVTRGHLNKCLYMTGVPSLQVHFNVKVHPDRCPLITGLTVCLILLKYVDMTNDWGKHLNIMKIILG